MSDAELALRITSDASDAVRGLDSVGDASTNMAREVERASRAADIAVDRMGSVADSADTLDSKASQATGSLGALSSGFELVGAEKFAGGLQAAALATDFLSGVGAGLNLIMDGTALASARAAISTTAQGVAAKATAASQWLLNAALSANPIGLVVIAVAALVAGFILLYKKSETVRDIVRKVGEVGRQAIGWVIDAASNLVGWFRDSIPSAVDWLKDKAVAAFKLITTPQRAIIDLARDLVGWFRDKIPGAIGALVDKARDIGEFLLKPFQAVADVVQDIIDLIGKIPNPGGGVPFVPGIRAVAGPTVLTAADTFAAAPVIVNVTVPGLIGTQDQLVDQITVGVQRALRQVAG